VWNSWAHRADIAILVARTDSSVPKHKGLTYFILDMKTPGVKATPIRKMSGGAEFNQVFLTDVRIPAANVVGPVNEGWKVANSLLGLERGEEAATNPIYFKAELERVIQLARDKGRINDPIIRDRLAWCHMKVEMMRFLGYRILTQVLRDGALGPEASISKLFWSEYHQALTDLAMELLGPEATVREGRRPYKHYRADEPGAANNSNSWIDVFLMNARSGTVYAGTSQIQRNIIAGALGLKT